MTSPPDIPIRLAIARGESSLVDRWAELRTRWLAGRVRGHLVPPLIACGAIVWASFANPADADALVAGAFLVAALHLWVAIPALAARWAARALDAARGGPNEEGHELNLRVVPGWRGSIFLALSRAALERVSSRVFSIAGWTSLAYGFAAMLFALLAIPSSHGKAGEVFVGATIVPLVCFGSGWKSSLVVSQLAINSVAYLSGAFGRRMGHLFDERPEALRAPIPLEEAEEIDRAWGRGDPGNLAASAREWLLGVAARAIAIGGYLLVTLSLGAAGAGVAAWLLVDPVAGSALAYVCAALAGAAGFGYGHACCVEFFARHVPGRVVKRFDLPVPR